jgi:hypothetical protein
VRLRHVIEGFGESRFSRRESARHHRRTRHAHRLGFSKTLKHGMGDTMTEARKKHSNLKAPYDASKHRA